MPEQSVDRALRESIDKTLHQIADSEQPASKISIQQALRDGRALLRRRRRLRAIGTPALAAAAASAIAISSVSLPTGDHRAGHKPGPSTATARRFSALAPYATFGWLPASEPVVPGQQRALAQLNTWGTIDATSEHLSSGPWALSVYAVGTCHRTGNQIDCGNDQPQPGPAHPCGFNGREVSAPPVNGHQSFWADDLGSLEPARIRCLTWEYAPGGWASLSNLEEIHPDKSLVVRVASAIRIGGRQPSFKFAAQFRKLPGKWRVVPPASFYLMHGALLAGTYAITDGATTIDVNIGSGFSKPNRCLKNESDCRVINGYHVGVLRSQPVRGETVSQILAPDADHRSVALISHQHLGLLFTVFSHLAILGRNPAAWTTKPIS